MCFKAFLLLSLVLLSVSGWTPTTRLQRDASPKFYSLRIVPFLENNSYSGEVTIFIEIPSSMRNITLNSRNLTILEITLDQEFDKTKFELDPAKELLHVFYEDNCFIDPGEHLLNIKFTGSLNGYYGFYMVNFMKGNVSRKMLATKFSSIHARSAFPCFDEPFYKSIFSIRLVKPDSSWTALSNMKEIGTYDTRDGIAVDFQSSFPMSTYLLTWILTDYKSEEQIYSQKNRNIPVRFFSGNGDHEDSSFAIETSKKVLKFFEEYTNISYPLPKLDFIEVPHYRSRGMEHWGLVVYLDKTITFDPEWFRSRLYHSIDATILISHELSHMWFGNLVTHEWYNDLWLTEGIARFMQYKAAESIVNEKFISRLFRNNKVRSLFELQCASYVEPETASYVRTLDDVMRKFGTTVYDQGAALLQMIEDVIGPENIKTALRKHLIEHQYGHATTGDFINTIQSVVPSTNIRNCMETFLFQEKLPLVLVKEDEKYYIIEQEPFCDTKQENITRKTWTIPIKYITSTNRTARITWFDKDMTHVRIPKNSDDKWIKINHLNKGLFKSLYTNELYQQLSKDMKVLDREDMGALLQETFMLATEEKIACKIPLQLVEIIRNIEALDFVTFTYASRSFSLFMNRFNFEKEASDILQSYFIHVFENAYHETLWTVGENETIDHRLLRIAVLESLCLYNAQYSGCYRDAKVIDSKNLTLHNDISYIYKQVIKRGESQISPPEGDEPIVSVQEEPSYQTECASWIRENLLKKIEEFNKINE